jgi:hypothetical protein
MTLATLFLLVSLILAILAAVGWPKETRVGLFPLAFSFFVLAVLVGGVRIVGID